MHCIVIQNLTQIWKKGNRGVGGPGHIICRWPRWVVYFPLKKFIEEKYIWITYLHCYFSCELVTQVSKLHRGYLSLYHMQSKNHPSLCIYLIKGLTESVATWLNLHLLMQTVGIQCHFIAVHAPIIIWGCAEHTSGFW